MPIFTDQLNRKIELPFPPKRIISLVPSQTELLYDLGLRDEVIGITKFCIHPDEWFHKKTRIGGTKKIDFEKIKLLNPDLIIGNKEENEKGQVESLMEDFTVWMSDIYTLKDALKMIVTIGELIGKNNEAVNIKLKIESHFNTLNFKLLTLNSKLKVAYFIWQKPYMAAGNNTFINDMLNRCGLINVFASPHLNRYPEVSEEQIAEAKPEIIFLSSEPFPFKEKHIQKFQSLCPESKIVIVDGELFSWYGSRLLQAPSYFEKLIRLLK
jgi:ABC-type Fe3+-hydroxamate transport system substrate-binding protein